MDIDEEIIRNIIILHMVITQRVVATQQLSYVNCSSWVDKSLSQAQQFSIIAWIMDTNEEILTIIIISPRVVATQYVPKQANWLSFS